MSVEPPKKNRAITVGAVIGFLRASRTKIERFPAWPPDVFAIAALLLQRSGGYTRAVAEWPPDFASQPRKWASMIRKLGTEWRNACRAKTLAPLIIRQWWSQVVAKAATPVEDIFHDLDLCNWLLQLLAVADEACAGAGVPDPARKFDDFDNETLRLLLYNNTLCREIDPSLYCVLPKLHTPQTGITLRSLSHHLALCTVGEVRPRWNYQPALTEDTGGLNLLLVPWPLEISALSFTPTEVSSTLKNLPSSMGFFSYKDLRIDWPTGVFKDLLRSAIDKVGRIDGVIFPELALKSTYEFGEVVRNVSEIDKQIFVVAGVGGKDEGTHFDVNCVKYYGPQRDLEFVVAHEQHKHHRWKLDESQIRQYELAHRLDPYKFWWENTELKNRELHFFATHPWLTLSLLICEDLARQDPVADLMRSVGPNLVIALLMDGPQIQGRWSGRYATVFADDPGSSVLALTSLGMARRSKPRGLNGPNRERAIGLWKDASGTAVEIDLPQDASGMILTLNRMFKEEWTADGRGDGCATAYLTLGGMYPV